MSEQGIMVSLITPPFTCLSLALCSVCFAQHNPQSIALCPSSTNASSSCLLRLLFITNIC